MRLQSLGFAKLVVSGPSPEIRSAAVELHADYQCCIKRRALRARRLLYAEHSGSRHCPVPFAMQHTSRPAAGLLISPGTSAAYAKPSGETQRIWGTSGREQEFPFVGLQGSAGTHYTSVSREAKNCRASRGGVTPARGRDCSDSGADGKHARPAPRALYEQKDAVKSPSAFHTCTGRPDIHCCRRLSPARQRWSLTGQQGAGAVLGSAAGS